MVLGFYRLHKLVSMLRKEGPNGEKIAVLLRELNGQGKINANDFKWLQFTKGVIGEGSYPRRESWPIHETFREAGAYNDKTYIKVTGIETGWKYYHICPKPYQAINEATGILSLATSQDELTRANQVARWLFGPLSKGETEGFRTFLKQKMKTGKKSLEEVRKELKIYKWPFVHPSVEGDVFRLPCFGFKHRNKLSFDAVDRFTGPLENFLKRPDKFDRVSSLTISWLQHKDRLPEEFKTRFYRAFSIAPVEESQEAIKAIIRALAGSPKEKNLEAVNSVIEYLEACTPERLNPSKMVRGRPVE